MPFDGKLSDYTQVAPVFDAEHPPTRMSDAIRMAVADVEALLANGYRYDWTMPTFIPADYKTTVFDDSDRCLACTAGAVVARMYDYSAAVAWDDLPGQWPEVLESLSKLTGPHAASRLSRAWQEWPEGFSGEPAFKHSITDAGKDPIAFSRDMLALADRLQSEGS